MKQSREPERETRLRKPLCAVILDVDGTLIDSNDAHASAFVEALAAHGHSTSFDEVRRLIGMGSDKLLWETAGLDKSRPPGKQISDQHGETFRTRYLPHLKPFPGVTQLLSRMRGEGLKLVVATSANEKELEALLKAAGVVDLIDDKTSSSDVQESKPDPDVVQAALDKSGCPAHQVLMLGDTPYDVAAARQTGVEIIALRCGGWADADLAGAAAIYDDPADLLAHYDQSPLSRGASTGAGSAQAVP